MKVKKEFFEGICIYPRDFEFIETYILRPPFKYDPYDEVIKTSNGIVVFDCGRWGRRDMEWQPKIRGKVLEKILNSKEVMDMLFEDDEENMEAVNAESNGHRDDVEVTVRKRGRPKGS